MLHERRIFHLADIEHNPAATPGDIENAGLGGYRTRLMVPMVRGDRALGLIAVTHQAPTPFPDQQIELLKTFADQAVIAIENARLFQELQAKNRDLTETLEQRTATSEILKVISSSPTDVQPVFDAIVQNAVRLCGGLYGQVFQFDGELIHLVAQDIPSDRAEEWLRTFPRPLAAGGGVRRVITTGAVLRLADVELDTDKVFSVAAHARMRDLGTRSLVLVPMFRRGLVIGVIVVTHRTVGAFTDAHVELLKTFAAQAVIAIENARLFKELESRNAELTETLARQTATGEVLRAISGAHTDAQPVFDIIAASAFRLCGAGYGSVQLYDGELIHLAAAENASPEGVEALRRAYPRRPDQSVGGRAIRTRAVVQILDILEDPAYELKSLLQTMGFRSLLAVPMLRDGDPIGAIVLGRPEPGPFSDKQIALLQTFADQAVIAIENVRLFKELEAVNRELEAASQHKSEFLANMSHELRTPLNAIIGFSEVLSERMFGDLNEKQEEYLKDIHASGQHLLSLINDILDLSKIEAGRMELEVTDVDLPTAIENALVLVRERAGRRGIDLHQALDQRLGTIRGDERKIKQVLLNLLSNALKFTPEGGRIDIRAGLVGGMAEITVTDTGVGIAPEDQEAIFEEFRQVGTAAKKVEGTGLGLALSRKFIELHGGRIWVKSRVGAGSMFTFTLPRSDAGTDSWVKSG